MNILITLIAARPRSLVQRGNLRFVSKSAKCSKFLLSLEWSWEKLYLRFCLVYKKIWNIVEKTWNRRRKWLKWLLWHQKRAHPLFAIIFLVSCFLSSYMQQTHVTRRWAGSRGAHKRTFRCQNGEDLQSATYGEREMRPPHKYCGDLWPRRTARGDG